MPRTKHGGLIYYPLDSNFFYDPKILSLAYKYGTAGTDILLRLYGDIYRDYGYYMIFDFDQLDLYSSLTKLDEEKIFEILNYLNKRKLLIIKSLRTGRASTKPLKTSKKQEELLEGVSKKYNEELEGVSVDDLPLIITSKGIQSQYQESVKKMGTSQVVDYKIWVKEPTETYSVITVSTESRFPKLEPLQEKEEIFYLEDTPNGTDKGCTTVADEAMEDYRDKSGRHTVDGSSRKEGRHTVVGSIERAENKECTTVTDAMEDYRDKSGRHTVDGSSDEQNGTDKGCTTVAGVMEDCRDKTDRHTVDGIIFQESNGNDLEVDNTTQEYLEVLESTPEYSQVLSRTPVINKNKINKNKLNKNIIIAEDTANGTSAPKNKTVTKPKNNFYKPVSDIKSKKVYGEFQNVWLKDKELETLKDRYPNDYQEMIENISRYKASKGIGYASDYATINQWNARNKRQQQANSNKNQKVSDENLKAIEEFEDNIFEDFKARLQQVQ